MQTYDADNICWWIRTKEDWRHPGDKELTFTYGRCRSGKRWFWALFLWRFGDEQNHKHHGWAASEAEAKAAAHAVVKGIAAGRRAVIDTRHGWARDELKELNQAEQAARLAAHPSSAKNSKAVEYLYGYHPCSGDSSDWCECHRMSERDRWNCHIYKFVIIKKTKQRIYYDRAPLDFVPRAQEYANTRDLTDRGTGRIDRQKLEREGELWTGKPWQADSTVYLHPPTMPEHWRRLDDAPDLRQLKAEMAAAHPDHGGDDAAFITARARYIDARRQKERRS